MSYTVLARRYRSQSFGSVVGQAPIAATLTNAIASGRVAHAYLFCGTRGVGKTSMARIFARALNAPDTVEDAPRAEDVAYPEADVQQRMAQAIMTGQDLNVIEIDGASHGKVEEARQLISGAGLSPTGNARFKIYIIDEVHMLSTAAFNALLKTMEEPPPHVKFILATTEPHKVPPTIQSRCQRFDFRNIPTAQIAEHLKDVLAREEVEAQGEVLFQLARMGNGSMRDALSLTDRLLATGASPITAKTLQDMLGLPDHELVASWVESMANGDVKATLEGAADLLNRGIGQDQLVEVLIERLRQLMIIAACGEQSELVELSEDARAGAAEQAKRFDAAGLVHMIALCENLLRFGKNSSNPRALLDATVVRLALAEKMADVTALLAGGAVAGGSKKKALAPAPRAAEPAAPARPQMKQGAAPARDVRPAAAKPASPAPLSSHAAPAGPSAAPSASGAAPAVDVTNTQAVWSATKEAVGRGAASAWLTHFSLGQIDSAAGTAELVPRPGLGGGGRSLATEPRLQKLSAAMAGVLGQPVRLTLGAAAAGRQVDGAAEGSAAVADPGATSVDRRDALALPLVREALDIFPEATFLSARRRVGVAPEAGEVPAQVSEEVPDERSD